MKKILFGLMITVVATLAIASCNKKEEIKDCTDLVTKVNAAAQAYTSDPTSAAKCSALKTAYKNMLNCSAITTAQRSQYQAALDGINSLCP